MGIACGERRNSDGGVWCEGHVANAVVDSRFGVSEVRRSTRRKLHAIHRNQFEPFAAAIIGIDKATVQLPTHVIAKLLYESRSHGENRSRPVRLLSFGA